MSSCCCGFCRKAKRACARGLVGSCNCRRSLAGPLGSDEHALSWASITSCRQRPPPTTDHCSPPASASGRCSLSLAGPCLKLRQCLTLAQVLSHFVVHHAEHTIPTQTLGGKTTGPRFFWSCHPTMRNNDRHVQSPHCLQTLKRSIPPLSDMPFGPASHATGQGIASCGSWLASRPLTAQSAAAGRGCAQVNSPNVTSAVAGPCPPLSPSCSIPRYLQWYLLFGNGMGAVAYTRAHALGNTLGNTRNWQEA